MRVWCKKELCKGNGPTPLGEGARTTDQSLLLRSFSHLPCYCSRPSRRPMVDSCLERKVPDRSRNPEMRQGSTGAGYAIDKRSSASSMSTLSRPQPALQSPEET